MSGPPLTPVRDLVAGAGQLFMQVVVLEVDLTRTRSGDVISYARAADETGSVALTLWHDHAKHVRAGDVLNLAGAHCKLHQGKLNLTVGRGGKCERVGEFTKVFSDTPVG